MDNILEVKNLKVHYPLKNKETLKAVDDISFTLKAGETLGIVGESGCGKSSLGRAIVQLVKATDGQVIYNNQDITKLDSHKIRELRKDIQIIFQDPLASLDPRMTVGQIIAEPLKNFYPELTKKEIRSQVEKIMQEVGLIPEHINRYPHEFSGGQCQRIGIARVLVLKPKIIVCDEPVSALDVSIQAQIINLLISLQKKFGLALIFIAHDLSVVRHISDRIMVMYLGKAAELGDSNKLYQEPLHPYSKALLAAVPIPDPRLERAKNVQPLRGEMPSPVNPPSGCRFRTRCPYVFDRCKVEVPLLTPSNVQPRRVEQVVACHLYNPASESLVQNSEV